MIFYSPTLLTRELSVEACNSVDTNRMNQQIYRSENVGDLKIGDMVWATVKSHRWWPGEIYNEALASLGVSELIPFDHHCKDKSKQTNASNFFKAVNDAIYEVHKRAALGLTFHFRNPSNFHPTTMQGLLKVDVCGYDPKALYSTNQIKRARNEFQSFELLSFIKQLGLNLRTDVQGDINLTKNATIFLHTGLQGLRGMTRPMLKHLGYNQLEDPRSENEGHRFQVGDMVWGKVKSHPWWPGEIYSEALASHGVCETKTKGYVLVSFYGDYSYSWFDPAELIPFDHHYKEKSKQTNALNFLKAVDDAIYEVRKRAALGLACHCRNPSNFLPTKVQGFVKVDVCGYDPGALYSTDQIKRARNEFHPSEILSFIKKLGLSLRTDVRRDINLTKNAARVLAYRAAVFEEFDETYAQAFGVQPVRPGNSVVVSSDEGNVLVQVPMDLGSMTAEALCKKKVCASPKKVNKPKKKIKDLSKHRDEQKVSQNKAPQVPLKLDFGDKQDADGIVDRKVRALSPLSKREKAKGMDIRLLVAKVNEGEGKLNQQLSKRNLSTSLSAQSLKSEAQGKSKHSTKRVKVNDPGKKDRNPFLEKRAQPTAIKPEAKVKNNAKIAVNSGSNVKEALSVGEEQIVAEVSSSDQPTMLVMKFPHGSRLPSISELKAKFARFGPLDTPSTSVYWNSTTCQVVFLQKSDAESAYNYAVNGTIFGVPNVEFRLVELEYASQLEPTNSCLKNPNSGVGSTSASTEDPGVNFMLSASGSDGREKSNVLNIESINKFVDDINKKYLEFKEMNRQKNPTVATSSSSSTDISSQMMNLLIRCNEIVADIKQSSKMGEHIPWKEKDVKTVMLIALVGGIVLLIPTDFTF
ncbi:hypothetical protein LguiB_025662 [Lonicera macranthoides]